MRAGARSRNRKTRQPNTAFVFARLAARYGFPRHGNPRDVFQCAVYVLLSAQTTLEQARAAHRHLRRRWPSARALARAKASELKATIRACGFGESRTSKILALAEAVAQRRSLASLRALPDEQLEEELVRLPGIGVKTARVVAAMSALERDRFAVDTHVWRIVQRLGWVPASAREKPTAAEANLLERRVPPEMRRQLHACLVALGRDCCRPASANCEGCALSDVCATGRLRLAKAASARRR
jgi:endonuclease-3